MNVKLNSRLVFSSTMIITAVSTAFMPSISSAASIERAQTVFSSRTSSMQSITCPAVTELSSISVSSSSQSAQTTPSTYEYLPTNNACSELLSKSDVTPTYSFISANFELTHKARKLICIYKATAGSSTCPLAYTTAIPPYAPVTPSHWSHSRCDLKTKNLTCKAKNLSDCLFRTAGSIAGQSNASIGNEDYSENMTPGSHTISRTQQDYCTDMTDIYENYISAKNKKYSAQNDSSMITGDHAEQIKQTYSSIATSCPTFTSANYAANSVTQFSGFTATNGTTGCASSALPVLNACSMKHGTPSKVMCTYKNDQCAFSYESNTIVIPTGPNWFWESDHIETLRCDKSIDDCPVFLK